ncbi:hypothetical protein BZB76_0733 [Actinomadura pelletieri DSM 43383]|uniref:Uncharacterized protein n=1 Tax=Actinomadura pelletieri DSM 43383 TaxID=1120940 RepID=A0A495QYJ6_9ACTN|nr:hypothetical protein [Actinomadura pelletieri]RKS79279.1 hypothetical protein BZB76_0733 [Actinomadura pelletieri DSM 43383]
MRMRSALLALSMATFGVGVLSTGTANAASLQASITCDSATNQISTRLTGPFISNRSFIVRFTVLTGGRVTTGGTVSALPEVGRSFSVPITTGSDPNVDVAGYTRSWNASDYAYYSETVRVTLLTPEGAQYSAYRDATCTRDERTTVQLHCDPEAHTITATTTGVNFAQNRPTQTEYRWITTHQATKDSPRFSGPHGDDRPFVTRRVTVSESGSWSDTGYVHNISSDPYYYDQKLTFKVRDVWTNVVVGQGTAYCLYVDKGR